MSSSGGHASAGARVAFAALVGFHLRVGARLALRAAAPLAAPPVIAWLLQQDPSAALRAAAVWLLAPPGRPAGGLALGLAGFALASWAAPRVTAGMAGWLHHLPVSEATQRRAALVALMTAQASLVVTLALLAPFAISHGGAIAAGRLVAVPLSVAAAAVAAWPGGRAWRSRPLALLALVAAAPADLRGVLAALLLLLAAERLAGPLAASTTPRHSRRSWPLPLPLLVGVRALGSAALMAPLVALLPVGAMALLRHNNDLTPAVAAGAARFGGGLGVAFLLAVLVERLSVRRPVWPWARSLPIGALRRVGEDGLLLGLPCLLILGATALLDPLAALGVAACLPLLVLRAAGSLRASGERRSGPSTAVLAQGALLASWVAILPWLALAALAAAPLAWRGAASRDRGQQVSRWQELHHRASGDPLSWSAR